MKDMVMMRFNWMRMDHQKMEKRFNSKARAQNQNQNQRKQEHQANKAKRKQMKLMFGMT